MNTVNFENKIGYKFKNRELLTEALTHSSYANELLQRGISAKSNERLEFLGDAVLEVISSTHLFKEFPDMPEGELTLLRSATVCTEALSSYARKIGLGELLVFSNGESKTGKFKDKNLENAFEALIGALYLDSGCSLTAVKKFLLPFLTARAAEVRRDTETIDCKSRLQQIIQETPGEELKYELVERTGPDHAPTFKVHALLNSCVIGKGVGGTKKQAEQNAARNALAAYFKSERKNDEKAR